MRSANKRRPYDTRNGLRIGFGPVGTVGTLAILTDNWLRLLFSVGVIGFAITFALQPPLLSLVAWVSITVKQPYCDGDRVRIGVEFLVTTLREVNGELVTTNQPSGRIETIGPEWSDRNDWSGVVGPKRMVRSGRTETIGPEWSDRNDWSGVVGPKRSEWPDRLRPSARNRMPRRAWVSPRHLYTAGYQIGGSVSGAVSAWVAQYARFGGYARRLASYPHRRKQHIYISTTITIS